MCPLGGDGDEVECWMKYRRDYSSVTNCDERECTIKKPGFGLVSNTGTCQSTEIDDPWEWFKKAKISACEAIGGRVGITSSDDNVCYLRCERYYDTFDYTCTGWKSRCVNWGGSSWTGCLDTYHRVKVTMWGTSAKDKIYAEPNRFRYCRYCWLWNGAGEMLIC